MPQSRLRAAAALAVEILRAVAVHRDTTLARLVWASHRRRRFHPGVFRLPMMTLRYSDIASLASQYREIVVDRGYEFDDSATGAIVDCGSNIGLSVAWFAARYPGRPVTAFEADPEIAKILEQNVASLGDARVTIVKAAVSGEAGLVGFMSNGADGGRVARDREVGSPVPAVRLSDYISAETALLKLDVEGAEFDVLLDLCGSGQIRFVHRIACEIHADRANAGKLAAVLRALHENSFMVTLAHARSAPDLPGEPEPSPFTKVPDGRFLAHLYAWRDPVLGATQQEHRSLGS